MTVVAGPERPLAVDSDAAGFHGDYARAREEALRFLPRHPGRESDWEERVAEVEGREPAGTVWERAAREAERLGADETSREGAAALAAGRVLCVTTGQQPGLFLGPLYTIYKAMTAVALARRLQEKTGTRTVSVFWSAADDSDFGEVATAVLPGDDFRLARLSLDGGELPAGGMVGHLGTEGTRRALAGAGEVLRDRPAEAAIREHLLRALDSGAERAG